LTHHRITPSHISSHLAVYPQPTFRPPIWSGSARRHWPGPRPLNLLEGSQHTPSLTYTPVSTPRQLHPIGALAVSQSRRLDPPLLSQVAPTREEERTRETSPSHRCCCSALHCIAPTDSEHVPRSGCLRLCWRKSWLSSETSVRETKTERGEKRRLYLYHPIPAGTGSLWTSPPTSSSPPCDLTA